MKSKRTTSTSEAQHEVTEITGKDSTRAVEVETNKQNAQTHRTEQTMLVKVLYRLLSKKIIKLCRLPARRSGARRTTASCPTFVKWIMAEIFKWKTSKQPVTS